MSAADRVTRLSVVVSASSTTTGTILLGRTGGGSTFRRLIAELEEAGYAVIERSSSPIGAHGSLGDIDRVDFVLLVVREGDDVGAIGPVRPFQRVARDAGVLQGKVGMDRVALLVEDSVMGLTSDLGVSVMRYPKDAPEAAGDKISSRIRQIRPQPEPGIHQKLARAESSRTGQVVAPFLLFGLIGLVALIGAFVVALSSLGGGGDDESADGDRVELIDVTEALRAGAPTSADAASGAVAGGEVGGAGDPAGPSAGFGGDNQLFPATCEVALGEGRAVAAETPCAGAGVLELEGSTGPWRTELRLLAVGEGVAGELTFESGEVVAIAPGVLELDRAAASSGVRSLTLQFSAPNQHVHLLTGADPGDREATLTLRLDR